MVKLIENIISNTLVHKHKSKSRLDTCLESKTLNRIEPKNTSVVITCYGRNGKEVKRVTCTDGENGGMA